MSKAFRNVVETIGAGLAIVGMIGGGALLIALAIVIVPAIVGLLFSFVLGWFGYSVPWYVCAIIFVLARLVLGGSRIVTVKSS